MADTHMIRLDRLHYIQIHLARYQSERVKNRHVVDLSSSTALPPTPTPHPSSCQAEGGTNRTHDDDTRMR